jgi:hypothetical protein
LAVRIINLNINKDNLAAVTPPEMMLETNILQPETEMYLFAPDLCD